MALDGQCGLVRGSILGWGTFVARSSLGAAALCGRACVAEAVGPEVGNFTSQQQTERYITRDGGRLRRVSFGCSARNKSNWVSRNHTIGGARSLSMLVLVTNRRITDT